MAASLTRSATDVSGSGTVPIDTVEIYDESDVLIVDGSSNPYKRQVVAEGDSIYGNRIRRIDVDNQGIGSLGASLLVRGVDRHYASALSTTKEVVKSSSGQLYGYRIYNPNTVVAYIQMFNVATGSVTLGTTVADEVMPVPAGGFIEEHWSVPEKYSTAITAAATTTASGNTALGSALVVTFFIL